MKRTSGGERARGRTVAAGAWLGAVGLGAALAVGACVSASNAAHCRVGADCPSGVCHDGTCATVTGAGGGGQAGAGGEGGSVTTSSSTTSSSTTSSSTTSAGGGGAGGGSLCSPDHDGSIAREEVPIEVGLSAKFLSASNATFDTTGTLVGGVRQWDLTVALAGDHLSILETLAVPSWAAADYPNATYAARLSESQELLGVFEVTSDALLLRGVVSPTQTMTSTKLSYSPAVTVLSFPLTVNKTWSTTSTVSGLASGVAAFYTETYTNLVDQRGTLKTPFADFDALRVRVVLDRTVGALVTRTRTFAFVTECFGTVATLVSQANELGTEFSNIAEAKRLSN